MITNKFSISSWIKAKATYYIICLQLKVLPSDDNDSYINITTIISFNIQSHKVETHEFDTCLYEMAIA